jgi:hypothetical protein
MNKQTKNIEECNNGIIRTKKLHTQVSYPFNHKATKLGPL